MVLKGSSHEYGQESNVNRENVQLVPLQSCPVGNAHSASAAAWAGQSVHMESRTTSVLVVPNWEERLVAQRLCCHSARPGQARELGREEPPEAQQGQV